MAEIWFNEFRLSHLDEKGGWAAIGRWISLVLIFSL